MTTRSGRDWWARRCGSAGTQPFRLEIPADVRFLRVLVLAIAPHMINNAPIDPPYNLKFLAIGFVAWVALLSFIQ